MQNVRNVQAWHRANELTVAVRRAVSRFPRRGYSRLADQITRAAESVPFNIAEGCGTVTRKDFARFLGMAIRPTTEVESQIETAERYGALDHEWCSRLFALTVEVRKMTHAFRESVLQADAKEERARELKRRRSRRPKDGSAG